MGARGQGPQSLIGVGVHNPGSKWAPLVATPNQGVLTLHLLLVGCAITVNLPTPADVGASIAAFHSNKLHLYFGNVF